MQDLQLLILLVLGLTCACNLSGAGLTEGVTQSTSDGLDDISTEESGNDVGCPRGTLGCPCTTSGTCNFGAYCWAELCIPSQSSGGTNQASSGGVWTTTTTGVGETSDTGLSTTDSGDTEISDSGDGTTSEDSTESGSSDLSTEGSSSESTGMDQDETGDESGGEATTYWQDVGPIHAARCLGCHRDGGAAFNMEGYANARRWAAAAAAATKERRMPPWLATSDGSCGEFSGSMALSDQQITTLQRWVDEGTPEGTPVDIQVPDPLELPSPAFYQTPHFYPERGEGKLDLYDEYRCFALDPELAAPSLVTGYHVKPGNKAIVQRLSAVVVDPYAGSFVSGQTNDEVMAALDAESPDRLGWPCPGHAGTGVSISWTAVSWTPGQAAIVFPEGTGVMVNPTDKIVVRIHYNLADDAHLGTADSTELQLQYADSNGRPSDIAVLDGLLASLADDVPHSLPPGQAEVDFLWELGFEDLFGDIPLPHIELHGVAPHMNERGRKYRIDLENSAGSTCVVDMQNWDFNWQHLYLYAAPMVFKRGDTLRIKCTYDTSMDTMAIFPGWGTRNELCSVDAYFSVPPLVSPDLQAEINRRIRGLRKRLLRSRP